MKTKQKQIKEMTIQDIKKALEICAEISIPCNDCPYDAVGNCTDTLCADAFKLIIEQEKENEQLKSECKYRKKQYDNQVAENTHLHIEYDKAVERLKAQQREIDRLKANNEQLENNMKNVLEIERKQSKIDVLNELKTNLSKSDDFMDICSWHIDKLIKEVENEQKN